MVGTNKCIGYSRLRPPNRLPDTREPSNDAPTDGLEFTIRFDRTKDWDKEGRQRFIILVG